MHQLQLPLIELNQTIHSVISEEPYVKLLAAPTYGRDGRWTALAQVNTVLAIIEVSIPAYQWRLR